MADVKTDVLFVAAVLSIFLKLEIRGQMTIDSHYQDDSCSQLSQLAEDLGFQVQETLRLGNLLDNERQTISSLENRLQRLRMRKKHTVTATFIDSFDHSETHQAITKVEEKIYVLLHQPNRIKVYDNRIGFRFVKNIELSGTKWPYDMVYSKDSKCLYISDAGAKCIWEMQTTGVNRITIWLTNVLSPHSLSLSKEGYLMVPNGDRYILDIYALNATLIRILHWPLDVLYTQYVMQTSAGEFIIIHRLNSTSSGPWVISQLTNDGQLMDRFIHRNQAEKLAYPLHLFLDSVNNRLFVADTANKRVILLDSIDLTWNQVLVSNVKDGIGEPSRLLYDPSNKYLFVTQYYRNVTVYEIK